MSCVFLLVVCSVAEFALTAAQSQCPTCSTSCTVSPTATTGSEQLSRPHSPPCTDCSDHRSRYRFGKTLGAGTYGIVREADCPEGKVAVKIILKKNVRGNEQMVYDELEMLQRMRHPHIVKFHDWFESRVSAAPQLPLARAEQSRTNITL
jgi:hypothetical protein